MSAAKKLTLATGWLDGCSGCHMSFLDMDELIIELVKRVDVVYSPLVDTKTLPEQVDVGILEGSVSSEEDLEKAQAFRKHCDLLISLGDCAVSGNVPAMRNRFKLVDVIDHAYKATVDVNPQTPNNRVPSLFERVRPIHACVDVDLFVPGCPPQADAIWHVFSELLEGRKPNALEVTRFGA
jgi:NAD-reducing hydrogenase small subunit